MITSFVDQSPGALLLSISNCKSDSGGLTGVLSLLLSPVLRLLFAGARYNCLHVYDHGLLRIPHMAMQIKLVGIAANTAALHYIPFVYPIDNRPDKYLVVSL